MITRCLLVAKAPLHDVVADLSRGLSALGWSVEPHVWLPPAAPRMPGWRRVEAALSHPNRAIRTAARATRRVHREIAGALAASDWCVDLEPRLRAGGHDAVLVFLDGLPIGAARLVARVRPGAVFVSLLALTQERAQRRLLPLLRLAARLRLAASRGPAARVHRDVLRPVAPDDLPVTIYPSQGWHDEARAAGVTARESRVITLGVPVPAPMPVRSRTLSSPVRLLWVGRLSPEKGLHLFLEAMPAVSARHPVRLTVIAAPGPDGYARRIAGTIASRNLQSIVEVRPPVPRDEMIAAFARHDLLLFHSIFGEPVAQVMLHAAASGLPVVGPGSNRPESLLCEGRTAWCYADASAGTVAAALLRAIEGHDDERQRRSRALYEEVRSGHDLSRTVDQFDAALRAAVHEPRARRVTHGRPSHPDSWRRLVRG
ncbi:MAG: glycosyltransferase family 4 protein [Vicinamibacterales bacterium]